MGHEKGEPPAATASRVRLTDFGKAARNAGLTPATARKIRTILDEFRDLGTSTDDLTQICIRLLQSLGNADEQTNDEPGSGISSPGSSPVVRMNELDHVVRGWLGGDQLQDVFATTPSKAGSTRHPSVQLWLNGSAGDNFWDDEFDRFSEFVDSTITHFLPWMLRRAGEISEISGQPGKPWTEWASFIELGVDSSWATRLIRDEIITDRTVPFANRVRPMGNVG